MNAAPPLLETRKLSKHFGGSLANDAIDLAIAPGEIRGIIGPNGAGKSTLVNLMTGVHRPSSGEILLAGRSLLGLESHEIARKGLVRSFQVSRVFGNLSLLENLLAPHLAQSQGSKAREAGARQGVALARAHHLDAPRPSTGEDLVGRPARAVAGGRGIHDAVAHLLSAR